MPETQFREALELSSFGSAPNVAVIGASGGIGGSLADELSLCPKVANVYRLSRLNLGHDESDWLHLDLEKEHSIAGAASFIEKTVGDLDLVSRLFPAHNWHDPDTLQQEKSICRISENAPENTSAGQSCGHDPGVVMCIDPGLLESDYRR